MAKRIVRLTESELKSYIASSVNEALRQRIDESLIDDDDYFLIGDDDYVPTAQDVAKAIMEDPSCVYLQPGKNKFVVPVNGRDVDVTLVVYANAYRTQGRYNGYYELEDDPEIIEKGLPDLDSIRYETTYPDEADDDGSIMEALESLLRDGKIQVNYEDDMVPSEADYYQDDY